MPNLADTVAEQFELLTKNIQKVDVQLRKPDSDPSILEFEKYEEIVQHLINQCYEVMDRIDFLIQMAPDDVRKTLHDNVNASREVVKDLKEKLSKTIEKNEKDTS